MRSLLLARRSGIGLSVVATLFLLNFPVPAKANSITYTFTGTGTVAGSSFTYVSPSGFLSFSSCAIFAVPLAPPCNAFLLPTTTGSDLIANGSDLGLINGFAFFSQINSPNDSLVIQTVPNGAVLLNLMPFSLNTLGTQSLFGNTGSLQGTLNIAVTPVTATPEPSSLGLLATALTALLFGFRGNRGESFSKPSRRPHALHGCGRHFFLGAMGRKV